MCCVFVETAVYFRGPEIASEIACFYIVLVSCFFLVYKPFTDAGDRDLCRQGRRGGKKKENWVCTKYYKKHLACDLEEWGFFIPYYKMAVLLGTEK